MEPITIHNFISAADVERSSTDFCEEDAGDSSSPIDMPSNTPRSNAGAPMSAFVPPRPTVVGAVAQGMGMSQGQQSIPFSMCNTQNIGAGQTGQAPVNHLQPGRRPSSRVPVDRGTKLKHEDYAKILDYIEVRENFNAIHGAGKKTRIGGRYQSKKSTFTSMAAVLAEYGFPIMDGQNLSKRFGRYVDMYRKALEVKNSSGGGLTEEEFQTGMTIQGKLEKMCPHFNRMHMIYGERANVATPGSFNQGFRNSGLIILENTTEDATDNIDSEWNDSEPHDSEATHILTDGPAEVDDEPSPPAESENVVPPPPVIDPEEETPVQQQQTPSVGTEECAPPPQQNAGQNHRRTPLQRPSQSTGAPQRSNPNVAAGNDHGARANRRLENQGSATSKNNLASVYQDRCRDKSEFRKELIGSKEKWKKDELDDRKEARTTAAKKDRLDRIHKFRLEKLSASNAEKRMRIDQSHQFMMAHMTMKASFLTKMVRSQKSEAEITRLMKLIDAPAPSASTDRDVDDMFTEEDLTGSHDPFD